MSAIACFKIYGVSKSNIAGILNCFGRVDFLVITWYKKIKFYFVFM